MTEPFVAEIRIFACNFAPAGWAFCDGQTIAIQQNTPLFALIGITYGGNGTTNFMLPNLNGRFPLQAGQGPGLSSYDLGDADGAEEVTLLESQLPAHTHTLHAVPDPGSVNSAQNAMLAVPRSGRAKQRNYAAHDAPGLTNLNLKAIVPSGGGFPHNNMPPYLPLNFAIALQGVFPSRP